MVMRTGLLLDLQILVLLKVVIDLVFDLILLIINNKDLGRNDATLLQVVAALEIIGVALEEDLLVALDSLHKTVLDQSRLVEEIELVFVESRGHVVLHVDHGELCKLVDLGDHGPSLGQRASDDAIDLLVHDQLLLLDLADQVPDRVGWLVDDQLLGQRLENVDDLLVLHVLLGLSHVRYFVGLVHRLSYIICSIYHLILWYR